MLFKYLYEFFNKIKDFLTHDKCLHYVLGTWLFIIAFLILSVFATKNTSLFLAGIVVTVIAEVKEFMDYKTKRSILSLMDGFMILLGAFVIGIMLYWF